MTALRPIPGALLRELRLLTLHDPRPRESLKPVLSVLVAVAAASILNLDDLSWAAFSGYMVMREDMMETVPRALMRITGTGAGALFGLLLAPEVADSPGLLMVSLFIVSWIGLFQALTTKYSYAWVFFGLTAGLVVTEALASPEWVVHFAATRVAEVTVGTCSCLVVASLFSGEPVNKNPHVDTVTAWFVRWREVFREDWLHERWPLLEHSTRGALAVAVLPLVWRWFSIEDFLQTAVTSYVLMIMPAPAVSERRHDTIYVRMAHRTLGCLLGSAVALICIVLFGTGLVPMALTLAAGVWVGYHIQSGREGISYLGTQFTLGLLITLVQGPGPVTDITPGLERLLGMIIGSATLCLLILLWPLSDDS